MTKTEGGAKMESKDELVSENMTPENDTAAERDDEMMKSVTSAMNAVGAHSLIKSPTSGEGQRGGALDRFAKYVYGGVKHSFAAKIMTSYKSAAVPAYAGKGKHNIPARISSAFSSAAASSVILAFFSKIAEKVLLLRLKVIGTFFATFGMYVFIYNMLMNFLVTENHKVTELIFSFGLIILSLPFLFSNETLSRALCTSSFGRAVKNIGGIHTASLKKNGAIGKTNIAFALGAIASIPAFFISPSKVILFFISVIFIWFIFSKPEFGIVLISFLLTFASVSVLIRCIFVTSLAFIIKLLRKKRFLSFETLDAAAAVVFAVILTGFAGSVFPDSLSSSLVSGALLVSYFLTVNLLKSKQWLDRVTLALVFGISLSACIYLLSELAGAAFKGVDVTISGIFPSSVLESAIAVSPRPLVMLCTAAIPLALSLILSPSYKIGKHRSAACLLLVIIPLVLYASPRAMLAAIPAVILLLLIYSRKSLYVIPALSLLIPVSCFVFPGLYGKISQYATESLRGIFETSIPVWRKTTSLIFDNFLGGIGYGAGTADIVYPAFQTAGSGAAGHSYNTYIQMLTETGLFGLIIFLVFIFLFTAAAFTVFDMIDNAGRSPALRTSGLKSNSPDSLGEFKRSKENSLNHELSVNQYTVSRRIGAAAPLCSVSALLIYGLVDNIWYDQKVFLAFWLIAGVCAAYLRTTEKELGDILSSYLSRSDPMTFSETDIGL